MRERYRSRYVRTAPCAAASWGSVTTAECVAFTASTMLWPSSMTTMEPRRSIPIASRVPLCSSMEYGMVTTCAAATAFRLP